MSSAGSKLEPTSPGDEVQSLKLDAVESPKASPIDNDEFSLQTSDMFNMCLVNRPERLVTRSYTVDPIAIKRELAKAIIMHDYPLSIINDRFFKEFFFEIRPSVSPSTVRSDILQVYELEKSHSIALFGDTKGRIAITVHKWLSCDQTKTFVAITGHTIHDEDWKRWKVKARMMRFVSMPCSYTSEMLAKTIVDCLSQWEVTPKLSTVVLQDMSYESDPTLSDMLIDKLSGTPLLLGGKFPQIQCFARVVGLMVQDAFAVVQTTIDKIRASFLFWSETPQRETKFKEAARELGIPIDANKLMLDSVSKWNTTFLMLKTALTHKPVFCHLSNSDPQFCCVPSEEEWQLVEEICEKLELFYCTIQHVAKYNTANFALNHICRIKLTLSSWIMPDNLKIKEMALSMQGKFDKYFVSVRDIFAVAAVLDPRYKLGFVKFIFQKIYKEGAETETDHIRQICSDLFDKYKAVEDLQDENSPSVQSCENDRFDTKLNKACLRDDRKRKREDAEKYDLNYYLTDKWVPYRDDSDGLSCWWSLGRYEAVRNMARDILAVPICCVPPENMFDIGDSVLSPHRSKLCPQMVEALMCSQSCLWTSTKGSYSITNSYSWGTSCNYDAVEHCAAEEGDKLVKS